MIRVPSPKKLFYHVQQQHGSADCGLFALAFTTALCFGQDLCSINFDQTQPRIHCFQCRNFSLFPAGSNSRIRKPTQTLIPVYCICRLTHYAIVVGEQRVRRAMAYVTPGYFEHRQKHTHRLLNLCLTMRSITATNST